LFVEQESALPGVSRFFLDAIELRDFPTLAAILIIVAGICLIVFVLTDLVCAWLDPRLRYSDLQKMPEYL